MNTITVDTATFNPLQYLIATLAGVVEIKSNDTKVVLDAVVANIKTILTPAQNSLDDDIPLLKPVFTLVFQIIFAANTTTTTTTSTNKLAAEYLPKLTAALLVEPLIQTKTKVNLLLFAYGNITSDSPLCYPIINGLLSLIIPCYEAKIVQPTDQFVNVDSIVATVPQNITKWGLNQGEIVHLLNISFAYSQFTSSSFSARHLLVVAYKTLGNLGNDFYTANVDLVKQVVEKLFELIFTTPSYQVCLDEFISYESIAALSFTQGDFFKTTYPLLAQLLNDFINTNSLVEVETLASSTRWNETVTQFKSLEIEVLRTNLVALLVAEKLQAGKGFRFATLQGYFGLDSTEAVEEFIVEATTHGQISTKIDQNQGIVHVSRVVPRRFNPEKSWVQIQKRLQYFDKVLNNFKNEYKGVV